MGQIFCRFTDFAERLVLRGANDRRQQSILDRDRYAKIDIRILHDRIAIEGRVDLGNLAPPLRPPPSRQNRSL